MRRKYLIISLAIVGILCTLYFLRYEILAFILAPNCNAEIYAHIESEMDSLKNQIILRNLTENEKNTLSKACTIREGPIENSIELSDCDIEKLDDIIKEGSLKNYSNYYWFLQTGQLISLFDIQTIILEEGKKFIGSENGCNVYKAIPLAFAQMSETSLGGAIYLIEIGKFFKCVENKTEKECFLKFLNLSFAFIEKNMLEEKSSEDIEKASQNCPRLSCERYERIPFNPTLCGILNKRKTQENLIEIYKRIYNRIKKELTVSDRNPLSKFNMLLYGKSIEICGYCPDACIKYIDKMMLW